MYKYSNYIITILLGIVFLLISIYFVKNINVISSSDLSISTITNILLLIINIIIFLKCIDFSFSITTYIIITDAMDLKIINNKYDIIKLCLCICYLLSYMLTEVSYLIIGVDRLMDYEDIMWTFTELMALLLCFFEVKSLYYKYQEE